MRNILIILLLIQTIFAVGQTHYGDSIFLANKHLENFELTDIYTDVKIGNLISENSKHGIIFQQIDKKNYINQIKLVCFENDQIIEKIIDTLEIGILVDFTFIDKNGDNLKDLVLTTGGNRAIDFVYVFDKTKNTIIKIAGFSDYPDTKRIPNSNLLYSYIAKGCADNYWESALLKIEDFKIVELGKIIGDACSENEADFSITIKMKDKADKVLNYNKIIKKYKNGKFGFIESYWNENYKTN